MPKGDQILPDPTQPTKVRDRCYLDPGVVVNGHQRPQPIKGTILQSQTFEEGTSYLVVIDGEQPPGRWYRAGGILVKQGRLQPVVPSKQAWVTVTSPDGTYTARFQMDRTGVNSYLAEGFKVFLDDDSRIPR